MRFVFSHSMEVFLVEDLPVLHDKGPPASSLVVNVAKRHDILTCQAFEAERGLTTGTNEGDVESFVRRPVLTTCATPGQGQSHAGNTGISQHPATSHFGRHGKIPLEQRIGR